MFQISGSSLSYMYRCRAAQTTSVIIVNHRFVHCRKDDQDFWFIRSFDLCVYTFTTTSSGSIKERCSYLHCMNSAVNAHLDSRPVPVQKICRITLLTKVCQKNRENCSINILRVFLTRQHPQRSFGS